MEINKDAPPSLSKLRDILVDVHNTGFTDDCCRTESIPEEIVLNGTTLRVLHAAMGLATEAAEFLDALKKHLFYGKPLDRVNLGEEMGDLEWYLAIARDALQMDRRQIEATVVDKLKARYPDGFTEGRAEVRHLVNEREILETGLGLPDE